MCTARSSESGPMSRGAAPAAHERAGARRRAHTAGVVPAGRWLLGLFAIGLAAACSDDGNGGDPTEPEIVADTLVEIRLVDFAFTRPDVVIDEGTRVRWIASTGGHTITPDGHSEWARFPAQGLLAQNDTFEHVFDTAGEYPYFCEPHRSAGMVGSITVR